MTQFTVGGKMRSCLEWIFGTTLQIIKTADKKLKNKKHKKHKIERIKCGSLLNTQ